MHRPLVWQGPGGPPGVEEEVGGWEGPGAACRRVGRPQPSTLPCLRLTALAQLGGDLGALEAADFNLSSVLCWNHTYLGFCPTSL